MTGKCVTFLKKAAAMCLPVLLILTKRIKDIIL